jgi:hypothetical protein
MVDGPHDGSTITREQRHARYAAGLSGIAWISGCNACRRAKHPFLLRALSPAKRAGG